MALIVPSMVLLPLLFALYNYNKLSKEYKILAYYLVISLIGNISTSVLCLNNRNNLFISQLITPIDLVCLCLFFRQTLIKTKLAITFIFVILGFLIISLLSLMYVQSIEMYNNYTSTLEAFILIFYAAANLFKILDHPEYYVRSRITELYITSGILLYYSGSFIIFIIYNVITFTSDLAFLIWNTHATFLLLMYILFAIGLWKYKK